MLHHLNEREDLDLMRRTLARQTPAHAIGLRGVSAKQLNTVTPKTPRITYADQPTRDEYGDAGGFYDGMLS